MEVSEIINIKKLKKSVAFCVWKMYYVWKKKVWRFFWLCSQMPAGNVARKPLSQKAGVW